MDKSMRLVAIFGLCLAVILAVAIIKGYGNDARNTINESLVGANLTYYSIAGKPMNYTIGADDIRGIEKVEYNGRPAWKVRVGEGLAWDLTMDAEGKQILDTKQLFVT